MALRSYIRVLFQAVRGLTGFGFAHLRSFLGATPRIRQARFWVRPWLTASFMALTTALFTSSLKWPFNGPLSPNSSFFLTRIARALRQQARPWFRRALWTLFDIVLRI